jgi:DNA-binding LytR/AlgR family response regulator
MINCMIVDDEPLALELLEGHILRHGGLRLVAKCANAVLAFDWVLREKIDLVFLDIQMPAISGIQFARSLKEPPAIIFTTAFPEYALSGFELDAVDYLVKPITYERFERSVQKLLRPGRIAEEAVATAYTYFKVSGHLVKVMHADLLLARSIKDYILLQTKNGNYLTHMTMKYISELLPAASFARVHRSYLVNRAYIDVIDKNSIRIGGESIPIGESYRSSDIINLTNK